MSFTLRPYQRAAIDAVYAYWQDGGGNPLVVIPTGGGKSLIIAQMVRELIEQYPTLRIGIVTHTKELIAQNFQELLRLWPQAPAGIHSAGLGRRDTHSQILFCGVQSAFKRVQQIGGFDVLIVDEAHLIPRSSSTMYGQFIGLLRDEIPDMRIVGMTATPYRLDSGRLDEGKDALFDDVVYDANVGDLIEQGYLSHLVSRSGVAAQIDVGGVGKRGGEFIAGALEKAADRHEITTAACGEIAALAGTRRAWLAFCCGIDHAAHVRDAMRELGVSSETVNGEMAGGERDGIIRRFRDGQIRCLTSVNVLSIGFNVPQVDLIALMRPTLSTGLYVQQVGRGFRIAEGKENCLVLDYAGNVMRHGPVDAVLPADDRGPGKAKKELGEKVEVDTVAAKVCPTCLAMAGLRQLFCDCCGYVWPEQKPKHQAKADVATPILTTERKPLDLIPVVSWRFSRHQKEGSPDSLRVTYHAGLMAYTEWVTIEHPGQAGEKARQWWMRHGGRDKPPTVALALERFSNLPMPNFIQVVKDGQWNRIVSHQYAKQKEVA